MYNHPLIKPTKLNFSSSLILLLLFFLLIGGIGGYYLGSNNLIQQSNFPEQRACTMEAKLCPDGTSVGRTGPNCDFAPCPSMHLISTEVITKDWITFISPKNNFSIKYPPQMYLKNDMNNSENFFLDDPLQKSNSDPELRVGIFMSFFKGSLKNQSLKQIAYDRIDNVLKIGSGMPNVPIDIVIGDILGIIVKVPNIKYSYIFLPYKNDQYLGIIYSVNDPSNQNYQKTVDQILSTFKFLDN